jgi:hypothetical protein
MSAGVGVLELASPDWARAPAKGASARTQASKAAESQIHKEDRLIRAAPGARESIAFMFMLER